MKGLIELNNIAVKTVNSTCTTLLKIEGEGEVKVKIYGKCMGIFLNVFLSIMPQYDVNLRYIKVVEFKTAYLLVENHFKIH